MKTKRAQFFKTTAEVNPLKLGTRKDIQENARKKLNCDLKNFPPMPDHISRILSQAVREGKTAMKILSGDNGHGNSELSETAEAGTNARDTLALCHHRVPKKIVARYHKIATKEGLDLEDLQQASLLGALIAAQKFTPEKKYGFTTAVYFYALSEVLDLITANNPIHFGCGANYRHLLNKLKVMRISIEFMERYGRIPTKKEFRIEADTRLLRSVYKLLKKKNPTDELRKEIELIAGALDISDSIKSRAGSGEYSRGYGAIMEEMCRRADGSGGVAGEVYKNELAELFKNAIKKLPPKEQQVLITMYYNDASLRKIGQVMGLSHVSVRTLQSLGLSRIRKQEALKTIANEENFDPKKGWVAKGHERLPQKYLKKEDKMPLLKELGVPGNLIERWCNRGLVDRMSGDLIRIAVPIILEKGFGEGMGRSACGAIRRIVFKYANDEEAKQRISNYIDWKLKRKQKE